MDRHPEGDGQPARRHRPARLRPADPKQEYKKEGYNMFMQMTDTISQNVAKKLFWSVSISRRPPRRRARSRAEAAGVRSRRPGWCNTSRRRPGGRVEASTRDNSRDDQPEVEGDQTQQAQAKTAKREEAKIGRNEPCPCGSGKKYKKCHGATAA